MADSVNEFAVFWEDKSSNDLNVDQLAQLPFDFASWSSLLAALQERRASYVEMTAHPPGKKPVRAKVMLAKEINSGSRPHMSFENMKPG